MSRATLETTICDLCSYGGPWTNPNVFVQIGTVDLCIWCADDRPKTQLECGRHLVTFTADSWSCSCGEVYGRPLFIDPRVRDAVPSMLNATAHIHAQGA